MKICRDRGFRCSKFLLQNFSSSNCSAKKSGEQKTCDFLLCLWFDDIILLGNKQNGRQWITNKMTYWWHIITCVSPQSTKLGHQKNVWKLPLIKIAATLWFFYWISFKFCRKLVRFYNDLFENWKTDFV